jgi:hypothetical protein
MVDPSLRLTQPAQDRPVCELRKYLSVFIATTYGFRTFAETQPAQDFVSLYISITYSRRISLYIYAKRVAQDSATPAMRIGIHDWTKES